MIMYMVESNTGGLTMSISKRGYLILFLGIIMLAISFFATPNLNFTTWAIIFFISMGLCTVGMIMLIVNLIKQIRNNSN